MELHVKNVTEMLEGNNKTLKQMAEHLNASQGTIQYLQEVILAKDLEIDRLKKALSETPPTPAAAATRSCRSDEDTLPPRPSVRDEHAFDPV